MKSAEKVAALAVALLLATAATVPAQDGSEFLFDGYHKYVSGAPDAIGSVMEVYGIISTVGGLTFPIALDLVNYEYTLYIGDLTVVNYSEDLVWMEKYITYNGGNLYIYADPRVGGSPPVYDPLGGFTDGELILQATIDDGFTVVLTDNPFMPDGKWSGFCSGTCDFIGGTQLDALMMDYELLNWYVTGPVDDPGIGFPPLTVPAGFDRLHDVKITPPDGETAVEKSTWGQVKSLFR